MPLRPFAPWGVAPLFPEGLKHLVGLCCWAGTFFVHVAAEQKQRPPWDLLSRSGGSGQWGGSSGPPVFNGPGPRTSHAFLSPPWWPSSLTNFSMLVEIESVLDSRQFCVLGWKDHWRLYCHPASWCGRKTRQCLQFGSMVWSAGFLIFCQPPCWWPGWLWWTWQAV